MGQNIKSRNGLPFNFVDGISVGGVDLAGPEGSELVGYRAEGVGSATRNIKTKLEESVSITDFGNPLIDAGNSTQLAINKLGVCGGVVVIPPGNWTWGTTPKLPKDLIGTLAIVGYGAKINLTVTGPRVFDLDYSAPNETFRNYYAAGFFIDASATSAVMTGNHVLIGSRVNGNFIGRFNAENWFFENIRIKNVPQSAGLSTSGYKGIVFVSPYHTTADEITQNTITDITFKNVKAWGGDGGFQINAFNGGGVTSTNVYFDDINILDCAHYLNTPAPRFFACSHVHIGGFGYGDKCRVIGFSGSGSGDNCVEINAMQDAFVDNLDFEGFSTYGLFATNYHAAQDVTKQKLVAGKHSYKLTSNGSRAFSFGLESLNSNYGNFILGDLTVHSSGWRVNGTAVLLASNGVGVKTCSSFKINTITFTSDMTGQVVPLSYFAAVVTVGLGVQVPVQIGQISVRIYGNPTFEEGTATRFPRVVELKSNCRFSCNNSDINNSVIFSSFWVYHASGVASMVDMSISNANIVSAATLTTCFRIDDTPFNSDNKLRVINSKLTGTDLSVATSSQREFVSFENCAFGTNIANQTFAAGTSPYVYQNVSLRSVTVSLIGGTISSVEISKDNGVTWSQVTGSGNALIRLPHWRSMRVTHTTAPTVRIVTD